jgi:hemerythrin-like domain-containing protein
VPDTRKEIGDLLRQHEAIRAHMKFLTRALKKLTAQSHQGDPAATRKTELKEHIKLYRWSLYDFREAIRRHIEMDDRIFNVLLDTHLSEEMDRGHEEISRRIDKVIGLAEEAVYNNLGRKELNRSAAEIKEAVKQLCNYCESHIALEDSVLEPALREL